eukprot:3626900-Prymnesium_polylepis.1
MITHGSDSSLCLQGSGSLPGEGVRYLRAAAKKHPYPTLPWRSDAQVTVTLPYPTRSTPLPRDHSRAQRSFPPALPRGSRSRDAQVNVSAQAQSNKRFTSPYGG